MTGGIIWDDTFWCHQANDDPATGHWKLIIEATLFVTNEVVLVWSGVKASGNDPVGEYTRVVGAIPRRA